MRSFRALVKPIAVASFVAMVGPVAAQTYDSRPYPPQPRDPYTRQNDWDRTGERGGDLYHGYHRLRGRRYQAMRQLAQILDVRAQQAARQAARDAARGGYRERRLLRRVSDFARQASELNARLVTYNARPWDIRTDLVGLDDTARWVNQRVRTVRVFSRTFHDWDETLDVLERMKRLADGGDIRLGN